MPRRRCKAWSHHAAKWVILMQRLSFGDNKNIQRPFDLLQLRLTYSAGNYCNKFHCQPFTGATQSKVSKDERFELFKLWNNTFQRFIRFKYAKMQKLWNLQNIHHSRFMCGHTHTHITFRVTKSKPMHKHWTFLKVSQAQESLWLLTTSVWTESPINGMFCRAEWIIGPDSGGNILLSMAQKVSWQKRHCTLCCKVITTASLQSDCHLPLGNEAH